MNVLLSLPRSGNTLMRYYIELISHRPTLGCDGSDVDKPIYKRSKSNLISIKNNSPIISKSHKIDETKKLIGKDKLILIVRDFNECFGSFRKRGNKKKEDFCKSYVSYLDFFESHQGDKMIVYYEDLLSDLQKVLESVCDFLNLDKSSIPEIVKNKKKFEDDCRGTYVGKTYSKGLSFYDKRISFNEISNDKISNYISRYEKEN